MKDYIIPIADVFIISAIYTSVVYGIGWTESFYESAIIVNGLAVFAVAFVLKLATGKFKIPFMGYLSIVNFKMEKQPTKTFVYRSSRVPVYSVILSLIGWPFGSVWLVVPWIMAEYTKHEINDLMNGHR